MQPTYVNDPVPFKTEMNDLHDFNNIPHRIRSASVNLQKGIYHLFIQASQKESDLFGVILRLYQSLFHLCLTHVLLDPNFSISSKGLQRRLRALCKDPQNPTRSDIDPAALITHSTFEKRSNWRGLRASHPLHVSSVKSLKLLQRIAEGRHNLIYRPFLLDNLWEDCTLIDLLESRPTVSDVEDEFITAVLNWHSEYEPVREEALTKKYSPSAQNDEENYPQYHVPPVGPAYFLDHVFWVYEDKGDTRPMESLLLTYARMLNPNDEALLESLKHYRNNLLDLERIKSLIKNPEDWCAGDT